MLAKSWRRIKNNILLYKSGTEGFANSGLEPYSEYYASQIAKTMDLHYVDYGLSKWKGKLCSTCLLFTNENVSYIPVGRIIKTGGIESVIDYYKKLGESYYQELLDMLVFDAVILNEDRHFGNFGFLIDNKSNKIVGCAPIFDNVLSLDLIKKETKRVDYSQYDKYKKPLTNRTILVSINGTLGNVGVYGSEKIILGKKWKVFIIFRGI